MKQKEIYVGTLAAYIAARMQHPRPRSNGHNARVSTIRVDQHKEKFGAMRIYCTLAHEDEVLAKWHEKNNAGDPDAKFIADCFLADARWYRACYMDMVNIVPNMYEKICGQADYSELLKEDVAALDKRMDEYVNDLGNNSMQYVLTRYGFSDADELRAWFHKVYDQDNAFFT